MDKESHMSPKYGTSTYRGVVIKSCLTKLIAWWRHQMETFSALLALCAGNSPVPGEFPSQRPVTRSFDIFFDLRPNKRLSKQCGWWFETPSWSLWRQCNWSYRAHGSIPLIHWGRVTHIYGGNLTFNGSDNGLSPGRHQAIICINAGLVLIAPLGTNFSEILIEIQTFLLNKKIWKCHLQTVDHFV